MLLVCNQKKPAKREEHLTIGLRNIVWANCIDVIEYKPIAGIFVGKGAEKRTQAGGFIPFRDGFHAGQDVNVGSLPKVDARSEGR